MLTQNVKKVALSLLHGAISFPEKPDSWPSVFSSAASGPASLLQEPCQLHPWGDCGSETPLRGRAGRGRWGFWCLREGEQGSQPEGEVGGGHRGVQREERFLTEAPPPFLPSSTLTSGYGCRTQKRAGGWECREERWDVWGREEG